MERLLQLIEEGVIEEVFNQLKTGKEAEVWLVSHRGEPVAAKIYKAREFRSFKNDAGYKEGRAVRNTRTQRAMDKGSKFGRDAAEEAWKQAEADAMFTLHAAGVRVPKPVLYYEGVLLMEVIGDAEGRVAPRLVDAHLTREQAEPMYLKLRAEVIKMLSLDLIHGDLSEFNILLSAEGPVIIDFPQVVTAAKNSRSEPYFKRDLGNLLRFFSSLDPAVSKHASDADEIWHEYVRRDLSPGFVPSGRAPQQQQHRHHGGRGAPGRQGQGPGQQRGPGVVEPVQQQRAQGPQRGPGQQQQQGGGRGPGQQQGGGRGAGQPSQGGERGPGQSQPGGGRGPGRQQGGGRGPAQPVGERGPGQPQPGGERGPGQSQPGGGRGPGRQQGGGRGPGQQQGGGRSAGQPQEGGGRGPGKQQGGGKSPGQPQEGGGRAPGQQRRGPEVSFRGAAPARSEGGGSAGGQGGEPKRGGGAERRRPRRRF